MITQEMFDEARVATWKSVYPINDDTLSLVLEAIEPVVREHVIEELDSGWVLNNANAASVVDSVIRRERERIAKAIADAAAAFVARQDRLGENGHHTCATCEAGRENYIKATEDAVSIATKGLK